MLTILNATFLGLLIRNDLTNVFNHERVFPDSLKSFNSPATAIACAENAQLELRNKEEKIKKILRIE